MNRTPASVDHSLTFADEYVAPVRTGSKTATVRYDNERDIETGDVIRCVTPDGAAFAHVRVTHAQSTVVINAPDIITVVGATHGTDTWDGLRDRLNHYYDDEIRWDTSVEVVAFEVIA